MNRPNFFIVGAGKSGTSSLYAWLRLHPQIFMSPRKEPRYFATDMPGLLNRVASESEYLALFRDAGPQHLAVGEASTQYLFSQRAVPNIREFEPEARLVVMLRNPVSMAHSMYSEARYGFFEDEDDFESAWRAHARRVLLGLPVPYEQIGPWPEMCRTGVQVARLLDVFPREQVHFILHDDLKADARAVYESTLRFLGLPSNGRTDFAPQNVNKVHRSRVLGRLILHPPPPLDTVRRCLSRTPGLWRVWPWLRRLNTRNPPRQAMNEEFRLELVEEFRADVNLLGQLIGRDLTHWQR